MYKNIAILGIGKQRQSLLSTLRHRKNELPRFTNSIEGDTDLCLIFFDYPLNESSKYVTKAKYKKYYKIWPADYNKAPKNNYIFYIKDKNYDWSKWLKEKFEIVI